MIPNLSHQDSSTLLKAMSHPERLLILYALRDGARSLQELAECTRLSLTDLGKHLHKLRQLGIISATRFMRIVEYRLISSEVRQILDVLQHSYLGRKNR